MSFEERIKLKIENDRFLAVTVDQGKTAFLLLQRRLRYPLSDRYCNHKIDFYFLLYLSFENF